jgi:DNA-binding transcriptional ArsR family regulator
MKTEVSMQDIYKMQAEICKALAHPKRVEILQALCKNELTAGDLLKIVNLSKPNLSQHMAKLVNKGLVSSRKNGTNVFYCLTDARITEACNIMKQVLITGLEENGKILLRAKKMKNKGVQHG